LGFCLFTGNIKDKLAERVVRDAPHLVILELNGLASQAALQELTSSPLIKKKVPYPGSGHSGSLTRNNQFLSVDDFIVQPYDQRELVARVGRLTQKTEDTSEILHCGDLEVNLADCEVRVAAESLN